MPEGCCHSQRHEERQMHWDECLQMATHWQEGAKGKSPLARPCQGHSWSLIKKYTGALEYKSDFTKLAINVSRWRLPINATNEQQKEPEIIRSKEILPLMPRSLVQPFTLCCSTANGHWKPGFSRPAISRLDYNIEYM